MNWKNKLHEWYERAFGVRVLTNTEYDALTQSCHRGEIAIKALKHIGTGAGSPQEFADEVLTTVLGLRKYTSFQVPEDEIWTIPKGMNALLDNAEVDYL